MKSPPGKTSATEGAIDFTGALSHLQFQAQWLLDRVVAAPEWIGWALLAWAAVLILLDRRSLGLLAGSLLALGIVALSLGTLAPALDSASFVPGLLAILGGGFALTFGIISVAWASAGVGAVALGWLGAVIAHDLLGLLAIGGAAPGAGLGLFIGMANHKRFATFMPQLWAALAIALGAANLLASHRRGALVPQLATLEWAAGLAAALALPLLALATGRERHKLARLESRKEQLRNEELKRKLDRKRERDALVNESRKP